VGQESDQRVKPVILMDTIEENWNSSTDQPALPMLGRAGRSAASSESFRPRGGFTLIELLMVMVIIAMMMSIAVVGFMDMGRGAGVRASTLTMQSSLNQARQNAITYRMRTVLFYSNLTTDVDMPRGFYVISTNNVTIGATNFLSNGIIFTNPGSDRYEFDLDGSCDGMADRRVWLTERDRGGRALTNCITVTPLSGRVKSGSY